MNPTGLLLAAVLAKDPPTGEASKSGPWGLAIVLLLCLASYFLFKSMSRHMRKVREQFPPDRGRTRPGARPGIRPTGPDKPAGSDGTAEPDGTAGSDGTAEPSGAADRDEPHP